MTVVLYWMAISHPSHAARKMLDLKGVPYKLVEVRPLNQRLHVRLAGFRGGTVPALKLDGQRIQGSTRISRELDLRWPDPPLFPTDPDLRRRVEEAEGWGDREFQPIPRRLVRWAMANNRQLREALTRQQGFPAPGLVAAAIEPLVRYYAKAVESDGQPAIDAAVRADLSALPAMLDRVDQMLADGTLSVEPPNGATLQILATVRALYAFDDLRPGVREHACCDPALALFADYRGECPPFLPREWLEPAQSGT